MGPYDSPTFLGRKDKIVMGLTLGQLGIVLGGGLVWFVVILGMDRGMMESMLLFAPLHAGTCIIGLVRIAGLMIPVYFLVFLKSLITCAVYHVEREEARAGLPEWFAEELEKQAAAEAAASGQLSDRLQNTDGLSSRLFGALLFFRKRAVDTTTSQQGQEVRTLASLQVEQQANAAAHGVRRSLRSMFLLLVKGKPV